MADGQSLTIANSVLKNVYAKGLNEQINNETPALDRIKSTSQNITTVGGLGVQFAVHFGRNHGIGARAELEQIPDAGQQTYAVGTTGLKSLYGTVKITGQVLNQAKSDYQSFVDVVDEETSRLKTDLAKDQNRMVYGDGTGTLATVTTNGGSSQSLVVDDVHYIGIGTRFDVLQVATLGNPTPTPHNTNGYYTVTAINKTTNTITFADTAITAVIGDVLVRSGRTSSTVGRNSWNKEWTGFSKIIDSTGTLFNISPTTWPDWAAVEYGSVGALTELKMNAVVQDIRENGSRPTRIFTTPGCYNAYWNTLQQMRTYVNKTDLEGGLGNLAFSTPGGNIPIMTDFDAPSGTIFYVNENEIQMNTNVGWEVIDEQGSMWQKVQGYDAFVAEWRNYSELTTRRRNAHGKQTGVTEA